MLELRTSKVDKRSIVFSYLRNREHRLDLILDVLKCRQRHLKSYSEVFGRAGIFDINKIVSLYTSTEEDNLIAIAILDIVSIFIDLGNF